MNDESETAQKNINHNSVERIVNGSANSLLIIESNAHANKLNTIFIILMTIQFLCIIFRCNVGKLDIIANNKPAKITIRINGKWLIDTTNKK